MSAQDGVRFELFQVADEPFARIAGKGPAEFAQAAGDLGIVGLAEQHAPKFRGALDQLHIAVLVDFFVERREKLDEVEPLDGVVRAQRAPGLLQGGGGGDVSAASGDGGNQNAHGCAGCRSRWLLRSRNPKCDETGTTATV